MKQKSLTQHLGTATTYSLTSAGLAGFSIYLLNKYFAISFDTHELTFIIPTLTYVFNLLIVIFVLILIMFSHKN